MRVALALLAGAAMSFCLGSPCAAQSAPAVGSGLPQGIHLNSAFDLRQVVSKTAFQDDTVTYTEAVAGLNGTVNTHRIRATFSYAYSRHFDESGDSFRKQDHQGFARADMDIIKNRLTLGAGGFAALFNRDLRGQVSYTPDQANPNLVQTYSLYLEPHYHQPLTDYAEFDLDYRVGYNGTTDKLLNSVVGGTPTAPGAASSDVALNNVGDGYNQRVQAKLGNREKSSKLRWDLTSTTTWEDINRLDQRYRSYDNRFEVEYVLWRGFSLIANAGYEKTSDTQADILRDASGVAVLDAKGNQQADPTAPRRSIYSQSGATFEGGFRFQPNRRTYMTVRAGRRFGQFMVNGDARYEITPRLIVTASVSESIDSFGRLLTQDLNGISVRTIVNTNQVAGLGGCMFGLDPGTGQCLLDATQSITDALFRNRSAQGIVEFRRHRNRFTLTTIYSERSYLDSDQLQRTGTTSLGFNGGSDKTLSINGQVSHDFTSRQSSGIGVFYNRYQYALSSQRQDSYVGASLNYNANIGRRLAAYLNATAARRRSDVAPAGTDATASLGLRLQF